jgi:hypothetical protein
MVLRSGGAYRRHWDHEGFALRDGLMFFSWELDVPTFSVFCMYLLTPLLSTMD